MFGEPAFVDLAFRLALRDLKTLCPLHSTRVMEIPKKLRYLGPPLPMLSQNSETKGPYSVKKVWGQRTGVAANIHQDSCSREQ